MWRPVGVCVCVVWGHCFVAPDCRCGSVVYPVLPIVGAGLCPGQHLGTGWVVVTVIAVGFDVVVAGLGQCGGVVGAAMSPVLRAVGDVWMAT